MNRPGDPLDICLDLYANVTSTIPGNVLGGVVALKAWLVINSLQTGVVPK